MTYPTTDPTATDGVQTTLGTPGVPTVTVQNVLPNTQQDPLFTTAQIEKARQEERDKLYARISKADERFKTLEAELNDLKKTRDEAVEKERKRRQKLEEEYRAKEAKQLSAKELIQKREEEWNQKFAEMQRQQEEQRALYEREQEYLRLESYKQQRAAEELAESRIGPELIDFINGNTPDEVEESIATLREKTQSIIDSMRQAQTQARASAPGVSLTGQPPGFGPLDTISGQQQRQLTPDEIRAMPMNEYANYRRSVGIDQASSNRGLYG